MLGIRSRINKWLGNETPRVEASYHEYGSSEGTWNLITAVSFDGEKNSGELGPIKHYYMDHAAMRARSYQLYMESDVVQTVMNRFATWTISTGLNLKACPEEDVLKSEKIDIGDPEDFNDLVEARFAVYSATKGMADYKGRKSLNKLQRTAFINAIIGGDVLCVQRLVNGVPKTEIIDGAHISTPMNFSIDAIKSCYINPTTGNRVVHGVEIDETGQHVAFFVKKGIMSWERVAAYGENSKLLRAWMVYGLEYRIDGTRGIPLITAVMETAKKLDRYKEATLGSAEERQKVAYTIEHNIHSDGENPLGAKMARTINYDAKGGNPISEEGTKLANKVAATTNKQAFNMPIGSQMKTLESKNELYFKDFFEKNIEIVCAVVGIPPEVAMMKYDSNFSSARAAIKDWEHTITVERTSFAEDFNQPIYNYWFTTEVLANKIPAPGYLKALNDGNEMALAAYRNAKFTGTNVPHIDPLKEVMAERAKLGPMGANLPLTSLERATENLNGGDSIANLQQYAKELEKAKQLGLELMLPPPPGKEKDDDEDE